MARLGKERHVRCTKLEGKGKPALSDKRAKEGSHPLQDKARVVVLEEEGSRGRHLFLITEGTRDLELKAWKALFGQMETLYWAWNELDGRALRLDLGLHLASLFIRSVTLIKLFISLNLSFLIRKRAIIAPWWRGSEDK